jgi:hypothetical protein
MIDFPKSRWQDSIDFHGDQNLQGEVRYPLHMSSSYGVNPQLQLNATFAYRSFNRPAFLLKHRLVMISLVFGPFPSTGGGANLLMVWKHHGKSWVYNPVL